MERQNGPCDETVIARAAVKEDEVADQPFRSFVTTVRRQGDGAAGRAAREAGAAGETGAEPDAEPAVKILRRVVTVRTIARIVQPAR